MQEKKTKSQITNILSLFIFFKKKNKTKKKILSKKNNFIKTHSTESR